MAGKNKGGGGLAIAHGATAQDERGRFVKGLELTEKQRDFVAAFVGNGGNATQAAKEAGYTNPQSEGWRLRQIPAIVEAINRKVGEAIADGQTLAWGTMQELMREKTTAPAVRFQAARWTLEACGHGLAPAIAAAKLQNPEDKPLAEMSLDELEQTIGRMEAAKNALRDVASVHPSQAVEAEVLALESGS